MKYGKKHIENAYPAYTACLSEFVFRLIYPFCVHFYVRRYTAYTFERIFLHLRICVVVLPILSGSLSAPGWILAGDWGLFWAREGRFNKF